VRHVRAVLQLLKEHQLVLKRSKCTFGATKVAYLGHVISELGIAMDPDKVRAVVDWPTPKSVRAVRGFLGLAGYYRKFICDFGLIAAPLTKLPKKEEYRWTNGATTAFKALQTALTQAPILYMPDFTKDFIVDCDASGIGFEAVLHQSDGVVAYFSRPIAPSHAKLAAYERALIGLVHAVRHWRPYLWGHTFRVRTDHYSLKYLLDQRLSTIPQHHWVSKLLGYDFLVEFRPGKLNIVVDALSRQEEDHGLLMLMVLSGPSFELLMFCVRHVLRSSACQAATKTRGRRAFCPMGFHRRSPDV
jgi:hypothetical protein